MAIGNASLHDSPWVSTGTAESRALLVEPRILRRVIRMDRRLAGLGLSVPHATNYVIERAWLLTYVELEELGLPPTTELPRDVILIAKVADDEIGRDADREQRLAYYRRQTFHAEVHLALRQRLELLDSPEEWVERRLQQIGDVEFREIRAVLFKDGLLFPESSDLDTYSEFVAVYLELRYFAPSALPWYFPAIRDWAAIDGLVSQDIAHAALFESVQQTSSRITMGWGPEPRQRPAAAALLRSTATWSLMKPPAIRARRAAAVGNGIKAAILWTLDASKSSASELTAPPPEAVQALAQVVLRLQPVLHLSNAEVEQWTAALEPLLIPAASGIWTVEGRLLYDLQKACVEQERGVFQFDLFDWARNLGRVPIRRPLPLLPEVLITKHLRSAARRLSVARLQAADRELLTTLLARASEHAEQRVRERIRPLVLQVLDEVGLIPENTPERVARLKVVEELLDVIVEQGVANLGHLRDAISRNDIKLPDLAGPAELIHGDLLLLADRHLANRLAGLYRPGAIYLRSAQRLSSIAFGTPKGRFLTRYVALPFGGAFLILEGVWYLIGFLLGHHSHEATMESGQKAVKFGMKAEFAMVLVLGCFLLLLMHSPTFRRWCQLQASSLWSVLRVVLVEWPSQILNSPAVQNFLRGPTYRALRSYVIWPGIITLLARVLCSWTGHPLSGHLSIELFLVTALFLNSRIGRYVDERLGDLMLRTWQELRMRVFAAMFEWIMDTFHRIFAYLERIVYTVDEWLRFRAGDNRQLQALKLLTSTCWFFVSYVVILVFTLLIEPQINPIKHFPVVTVSHKLLLPAGPAIVEGLTPLIGITRARTLVWSSIWLVPGVFGFLVWELKENWRLYLANRSRRLVPAPVGHHGETMVRLLRPGFYSGTIPKLFAALRSALKSAEEDGDWKAFERKSAALRRAEESIHRFVQRKLLILWQQSGRTAMLSAEIEGVRVATSRVEVELTFAGSADQKMCLTWEENAGQLHARALVGSWIEQLDGTQREAIAVAITGLFQQSAADQIELGPSLPRCLPRDWNGWVDYWCVGK
jgi:hypothetical protein